LLKRLLITTTSHYLLSEGYPGSAAVLSQSKVFLINSAFVHPKTYNSVTMRSGEIRNDLSISSVDDVGSAELMKLERYFDCSMTETLMLAQLN
jgi:hypothetical protein